MRSTSQSPHVIQLDSDSEQSAPGDSPYHLPREASLQSESQEGDARSRGASPNTERARFSTRGGRISGHEDATGAALGEGVSERPANRKRKTRWSSPSERSKGEEPDERPTSKWRPEPLLEDSEVSGLQPTCPICLNDIPPQEKAVLKSCMHVFCVECIRAWSEIRRVCPLCKGGFTGWWYDIRGQGAFKKVSLPSPPESETISQSHRSRGYSDRGGYVNRETEERFNARPYYHRLQRGLQSDRRRAPGRSNQAHEREVQEGRRTQPAPRQRVFTSGQDGAEDRALRWRRSIYERGLEAEGISGPVGRVGRSQVGAAHCPIGPHALLERRLRIATYCLCLELRKKVVELFTLNANEASPPSFEQCRDTGCLETFVQPEMCFWIVMRTI